MRGLAITSLALGIIGILICWIGIGIIPAVLALTFGLIACFKRIARGMAIAGLVLGIIGTIISAGVIYMGTHPEIIWQAGEEMLKDLKEKEKFLERYSEDIREKAAKNANIPDMLMLTNPERYMDLVIKELKKHPERYPKKAEEEKRLKKKK